MPYVIHEDREGTNVPASVAGFLQRHEAAHNLLLGFLNPGPSPRRLELMAWVSDREDVKLVAVKTDSDHNLVLSLGSQTAAQHLAEGLSTRGWILPGVFGPSPLAKAFANGWHDCTRASIALIRRERVYEATRVMPPDAVEGGARWATESDVGWLTDWVEAFIRESVPEDDPSRARKMVEGRLQAGFPQGGYLIWEMNGRPVSMAGYGHPAAGGVRLAPVYTPPAWRGRGYGSGVVRLLTELLLQSGYRRVFLFADLGNPTSNAIYQRVGYQPGPEFDLYQFH